MGKKSKRKAVNKQNRKEKLEQRRERRLDEPVRASGGTRTNSTHPLQHEPIEKGDRVWYLDNSQAAVSAEWRRGIVRLKETLGRAVHVFKILPVAAPYTKENLVTLTSNNGKKNIYLDPHDWILRFAVGDHVVCNLADKWQPAQVVACFPTDEISGELCMYQCYGTENLAMHCYSPEDDDCCIVKRPLFLRCAEGQPVVFDSWKAECSRHNPRRERWIEGTVLRKDCIHRSDFYAAYEVSFQERGRDEICFVMFDDDEHIASSAACPRQRLLASIETDCSWDHIDYLVKSFSLEISHFQELLVAKAIESGSFDALAWLSEYAGVDGYKIVESNSLIVDSNGNGLLHQVAQGPNALRFFKSAAFSSDENRRDGFFEHYCQMKNEDGRLFLHGLVDSGNIRALFPLLSTRGNLAVRKPFAILSWDCAVDNGGMNLRDIAESGGYHEILHMLEEFSTFVTLYQATRGSCEFDSTLALLRTLGDESKTAMAKKLIRFCRQSPQNKFSIDKVIGRALAQGSFDTFMWLLEADSSALCYIRTHPTRSNTNEFALAELRGVSLKHGGWRTVEEIDVVSRIAHGDIPDEHRFAWWKQDAVEAYSFILSCYVDTVCRQGKCCSLIDHLKKGSTIINENRRLRAPVEYKLYLLQDDELLAERLKVLNYLVKVVKLEFPNVVDLVRWRRYGVVRWLVQERIVLLDAPANRQDHIARRRSSVSFLGKATIPNSMTTLEYLMFAAIEFDDLMTLQFLVLEHQAPIEQMVCNGLNAVHACALYGRTEIFVWLFSEGHVHSLLSKPCGRQPWTKLYAAHLAVVHGFIVLADGLLSSGCPYMDMTGAPIGSHALQSAHCFVKKWGAAKRKPFALENNIRGLLQLVDAASTTVDDVTQFIASSECLEEEKWSDCGYCDTEVSGPLGISYTEVVQRCCETSKIDLVRILLRPLQLLRIWGIQQFWEVDMTRSAECRSGDSCCPSLEWSSFYEGSEDDEITACLQHTWVTCQGKVVDPSYQFPILAKLILHFNDQAGISNSLAIVRQSLAKKLMARTILSDAQTELRRLVIAGAAVKDFQELYKTVRIAACECAGSDFECNILSNDGRLNLDDSVCYDNMTVFNPVRHQMAWTCLETEIEPDLVYLVLATEGYADLVEWSLRPEVSTWTAKKECEVIRVATHRGHTRVLDIFLSQPDGFDFHSSLKDRLLAAILGAVEAGRIDEAESFRRTMLTERLAWDQVLSELLLEERRLRLSSSLVGVAVFRCLSPSKDPRVATLSFRERRAVLTRILSWFEIPSAVVARALAHSLSTSDGVVALKHGLALLQFLIDELSLNVWTNRDIVVYICQKAYAAASKNMAMAKVLQKASRSASYDLEDEESNLLIVKDYVQLSADLGVDISALKARRSYEKSDFSKAFLPVYEEILSQQRDRWAQIDVLKNGGTLADIQQAVDDKSLSLLFRDRNGLLLTHTAAAYDRLDVLEWLVRERGASLDAVDGDGRTVVEMACISSSLSCVRWIDHMTATKRISSFLLARHRSREARAWKFASLRLVVKLQARHRANAIRQVHRGRLMAHLEDLQRFQHFWQPSLCILEKQVPNSDLKNRSWIAIKEKEHDTVLAPEIAEGAELEKTAETLRVATTAVLSGSQLVDKDDATKLTIVEDGGTPAMADNDTTTHDVASITPHSHCEFYRLHFTKEIDKWRRTGDAKYLQFFIRRMRQLASGERSRTLSKRLVGCKSAIYETYLEQKSGQRILWTDVGDRRLIIWYVATHDNVSRLASLIDDAEHRSQRQLTTMSDLPEFAPEHGAETRPGTDFLMLDPLRDVPLKLYEVAYDEIAKLEDTTWKPRLHLTPNEHRIVQTKGTVLLLGRSGTGKTCCICSRLDYDRHLHDGEESFKQLFVARSERLCRYVRNTVGAVTSQNGVNNRSKFTTFHLLVQSIESSVRSKDTLTQPFLPSQRIDFGRFKREVWHGSNGIDALIVWASIRSFIKGSIEALQLRRPMNRDEYMKIGKKRCRLSPKQRNLVYAVFLRYEKYVNDRKLFDDCDRIASLVHSVQDAIKKDSHAFEELRWSKIYVDECQDYNQCEIALFFTMSGPGSLFLAGDPAQSVAEGVEFRFEDIRSVGHHFCGQDDRRLIPDKPMTVNVNFRSHSGILDIAAGVLSLLFGVFPDAAKQLKRDRGVFAGPRPGVFHKVDLSQLKELVAKIDGVVILTHDKDTSKLKRDLEYPLVYGIREAKGLEFHAVIFADFFHGVEPNLQKPLRDILLGRDIHGYNEKYPELEGVIKLMYTGVTRSIQRLFFIETKKSVSHDAFTRWISMGLTNKDSLAVLQTVDSVEKMTRTPDEWRSAGLDNAVLADSYSGEPERASAYLEKAIYCFAQIGDNELGKKARTHRSSVQFRRKLLREATTTEDCNRVELEAAVVVGKLLSEGLYAEAKLACDTILPMLTQSTQALLTERLAAKIPALIVDAAY